MSPTYSKLVKKTVCIYIIMRKDDKAKREKRKQL